MKKLITMFIFFSFLIEYSLSQEIKSTKLVESQSLIKYKNFSSVTNRDSLSLFEEDSTVNFDSIPNYKFFICDYDNDNDYDILLSSFTCNSSSDTCQFFTRLFKNIGGRFEEQKNVTFRGIGPEMVAAWGDYDNDNKLDLLLSGWGRKQQKVFTEIYKNYGNNLFVRQDSIGLPRVDGVSASWGDYDNDGYLDVFITGFDSSKRVLKIIHNERNGTFNEQFNLSGTTQGKAKWVDLDNDGNLDIMINGLWGYPIAEHDSVLTKIYRNTGNNTFTEQTDVHIQGFVGGDFDCKDYDNDGRIDIAITGGPDSAWYSFKSTKCTKIYHNDGNNIFTEVARLKGYCGGSIEFGDFDNDGDLDLLVCGSDGVFWFLTVYENQGNNVFSEIYSFTYPHYMEGSAQWCDIDNNGTLDILIIGVNYNNSIFKLIKNNCSTKNFLPTEPSNLIANVKGSDVILSWSKSTDDISLLKSNTNSTTYKALNYNYYIESLERNEFLGAPMSDLNLGFHRVINGGNAGNSTVKVIKKLPSGKYAWGVQSIDNSNFGSKFSTLGYFSIEPLAIMNMFNDFKIYPNPVNDLLNIEFSNSNSKSYSVKIYDTCGRLILSKDNCQANEQLSLGKFNKGTYVINIISSATTLNYIVIKL